MYGGEPATSTCNPSSPQGCNASSRSASPVKSAVNPSSVSRPSEAARAGRWRSASTKHTLVPAAARVAAMLAAAVLLPSPGTDEVTTRTLRFGFGQQRLKVGPDLPVLLGVRGVRRGGKHHELSATRHCSLETVPRTGERVISLACSAVRTFPRKNSLRPSRTRAKAQGDQASQQGQQRERGTGRSLRARRHVGPTRPLPGRLRSLRSGTRRAIDSERLLATPFAISAARVAEESVAEMEMMDVFRGTLVDTLLRSSPTGEAEVGVVDDRLEDQLPWWPPQQSSVPGRASRWLPG